MMGQSSDFSVLAARGRTGGDAYGHPHIHPSQPMRFGNKAFRDWVGKLEQEVRPFLEGLVGPELMAQGAVEELSPYLLDAFGSKQRIDYGTGPLLFLSFPLSLSLLCCLLLFPSLFTVYFPSPKQKPKKTTTKGTS